MRLVVAGRDWNAGSDAGVSVGCAEVAASSVEGTDLLADVPQKMDLAGLPGRKYVESAL